MEREVKRLGKEVHSLCRQHKWLMFLTVPKVIILSDQITSNEHDAQRIVKEISFLFLNRRDVRSKLQDSVQVSIYIAVVFENILSSVAYNTHEWCTLHNQTTCSIVTPKKLSTQCSMTTIYLTPT